jgi:hypothetical protein
VRVEVIVVRVVGVTVRVMGVVIVWANVAFTRIDAVDVTVGVAGAIQRHALKILEKAGAARASSGNTSRRATSGTIG